MSTPEQPATPAITRKQLRDIRNTGSTPVVNADGPVEPEPDVQPEPDTADTQSAEQPQAAPAATADAAPTAAAVPLARAAQPVPVHDLPGADAAVDLGVMPLTRRQARQQERIRTASVPVITPEVAAAHTAAVEAEAAEAQAAETEAAVPETSVPETSVPETVVPETVEAELVEEPVEAAPVEPEPALEAQPEPEPEPEPERVERAVVNPQFGAGLLAADSVEAELPPSFDQLISRSVTGDIGTGNALILSQAPASAPLVAPVTATGEVMITGTFNLPEGLGSRGHAPGAADGKEVDAVLVDGELPAHSSPTPIAASAAISTVKNGNDIIKPPTPEKGSRLMLTLAITAGVLALALVGVLILAFVTGVF
jgi:hypothetical protein